MEVINDEYISKLEAVRILQTAYADGRIQAKDGCVSVLDDINTLPSADVQPVINPNSISVDDTLKVLKDIVDVYYLNKGFAKYSREEQYNTLKDLIRLMEQSPINQKGAENAYVEFIKEINDNPKLIGCSENV